ncbi:MAG: F0F1 ATP synthase subunit A [Bacteroidetes bacterium]|nr:F0F1 ATP synthase subunit A [Bacteroidota bacterium]
MALIRSLQGMFLAAVLLLAGASAVQGQQDSHGTPPPGASHHEVTDPASGNSHEGMDVHDGADGHEDADGHADSHGVEHLTPTEEMMRILEHKVENTPYIHEYPFPSLYLPQDWVINIAGFQLDMSPNRHIIYMWLSMLITIVLTWLAARQNRSGVVPRGYGNMIESVVVFVRDEIAAPFLGNAAKRYLPLLLSFFFFITVMNLVGLVPFGAASTGNINITAGLALITFAFMIFGGMRANGVFGFWKGLIPHGIPAAIGVLMFVIEVLGLVIKPFALAIRLFANMLSGALVIGAFYALIFGMDTLVVAPMSIAFLLFMSLLKIFISFLQAYIFTMLSSFFIGMSVHQEH